MMDILDLIENAIEAEFMSEDFHEEHEMPIEAEFAEANVAEPSKLIISKKIMERINEYQASVNKGGVVHNISSIRDQFGEFKLEVDENLADDEIKFAHGTVTHISE